MESFPTWTKGPGSIAAAFALCTTVALAQSTVSVTLNGAPLALNPAPVERAGRVFVPLRGVFEQLGASVVYANGTINAQGRGDRSVSLHIGSTQATVDGQPQTLDVAPFIIGASTYVPLRFISQSLGAIVNYDAANRIVALSTPGGPPQAMQAPAPPQRSSLVVSDLRPARGADVAARRPTIQADFSDGRANPNSIRVSLDGLNVTDQTTRSPRGIVYSPPSALQPGRHEVRVAGTDLDGRPFEASWGFISGTSDVANSITDLRPGNGADVRDRFMVAGRTLPGARVTVQVGAANGSQYVMDRETVQTETTADGYGNFETPIAIPARPGEPLTLIVDSTDAQTHATARAVRSLTAAQ